MNDPLWLLLTYGAASLSTWIGWRNRDNLVSGAGQRPMAQLADQTAVVPRTNPRAPAGNGGWHYLFWNTAQMYAIWALIFSAMMWMFGYLFTAMSSLGTKPVVGNFFSIHNPGAIVMWLMIVAISLRPVFQPRLLRMLPIRPAMLAALMLGLPMLASIVTMGLAFGVISLFSSEPNVELLWNRASQLIIFFVVGIPVILRWRMSMVSLTLLLMSFMIFVGVTSEFRYLLPVPILLPAALASYWLIHRLLTRSSAPYKAPPTWPGFAQQ